MATLSVLITYHNEGPLLTECLQSLWQGTQLPDEILIYDDASSIPPQEFIPANIPVHVIRSEKNCGPGHGRNVLMRTSQCDYVHCHDADDMFHPDWCQQVRSKIEITHADLVITEISAYHGTQLLAKSVLGIPEIKTIKELIVFGIKGILLVPSTTYRRQLGVAIGGYQTWDVLPQSEDFDFHLRLLQVVKTFVIVYDSLIMQRIRPNSHSAEKHICHISAVKAISQLHKELPPEYAQELAERTTLFATSLYKLGYPIEAKWGFEVAQAITTPTFRYFPLPYQLIARYWGPISAEKIGELYRLLFPHSLRKRVRALLPNKIKFIAMLDL